MENVDKHPKSGIYRVRLTYPVHLHKILGRGSFTQSLHTREAAVAKKAALPILAEQQKRIAEAQAVYDNRASPQPPKPTLTLHEGIRLFQRWKDQYLAECLDDLNSGTTREPRQYLIAFGPTDEEEDKFFAPENYRSWETLLSAGDVDSRIMNWTLDRTLRQFGHELPRRHPLRTALLGPLRETLTTIWQTTEAWSHGEIDLASLPPERGFVPSAQTAAPTSSPRLADAPPSESARGKIRLSELVEKYLAWKKPKSDTEQRLALRQLCDFLGQSDPWANDITHEQAEEFYEVLKLQPKSRSIKDAKLSMTELAQQMRDGTRKQSAVAGGTAAKKISLLSAIFTRGEARNWISGGNPFARLIGPQDAKPERKRRPMTAKHVEQIFSAPLFQGCADEDNWRTKGNFLISNHRFWLPLLGMVTGCRLEELGQLQVSDIKKQDGILFLDITEEHETTNDAANGLKSLKTTSSKRKMPLHKIVLDAGFEDYWKKRVHDGEIPIFPELPIIRSRTKEMSRWFNRDFLHSVGIDDPSYVFHSFRHAFKDRCRDAKLHPEVHHTLTGHRSGSVGDRYGEGFDLAALKEGIDALKFVGFPGVPERN
ncbi:MAG: site-specific integrase [Alphaproteobacteria bacterium]